MLHLMANSTSPYYHDLLSLLLLLSPIILPHCRLAQFPSPMGFPFKIISNPRRLLISLNIMIMWRDIVINNANTTSSFKRNPLLVSSNVKLVWSSSWKLFIARSPPPSCCTKHVMDSNYIWTCWFLGYTTPKIFDKTNGVIYQLLTITTIHMFSKSWIHHIAIHHIDTPM
jgi:hypothetical protein